MAKKYYSGGIVYSTNPDFKLNEDKPEPEEAISPSNQLLKIRLDTKNRGGKAVTLVENFFGPQSEMIELGKKLKSFCGTGVSVKGNEIFIQGDNREKIFQWLLKNGFSKTKKI